MVNFKCGCLCNFGIFGLWLHSHLFWTHSVYFLLEGHSRDLQAECAHMQAECFHMQAECAHIQAECALSHDQIDLIYLISLVVSISMSWVKREGNRFEGFGKGAKGL